MARNLGVILPMKTAYEWNTQNPVLVRGQLVYESDTGAMKVGDGVNRYNDLRYAGLIAGTSEG